MGGLEWTLLTRRRCRVIAGPGTGDVTFVAGILSQPSHCSLDTLRALSNRQAAGRPGDRAAPSVRVARAVQMSGLGLSRSTTHQPPSQLAAQILHHGGAHALRAGAAFGMDHVAQFTKVDAAQHALDRADRGRAHRQRAEPDGGKAGGLDRAARILAAETEPRVERGTAIDV